MKVLALAAVCFVAITTTHGLAIGIPPIGRIGIPPFGIHPFGYGVHPFGIGIPHVGLGVPLGVGSGLVQPGLQNVGNVHSNDYGHDYIVDLDAQRASGAAAPAAPLAAPATGVAAPAPLGTAYVPAYRGF